jgi:hypothetical protein
MGMEHCLKRRKESKIEQNFKDIILMFFIPCSFDYILSTHYQQLSLGYIIYINQVIVVGNVYLIFKDIIWT